jgi:meiotically up-regulated gene 157 (Mug157) protein
MDTTNLLFTILFFLILFYLYLTLSKQNTTEEFTNVPKQTSNKVKKYLSPFDLTEFSFFIQLIVDADEFSKIKENSDMVNTTYWIGLQKYMVDSLKKGLKLNVIKYKIKLSDKEIDDKVEIGRAHV